MQTFAIRLTPGQDLKQEILQFAKQNRIAAGCLVTCVGSLTRVHLRYAGQEQGAVQEGKFEIVSLVGTFSEQAAHLHLSVSDKEGRTTGGHLLDGCRIYTTAELVLGVLPGLRFEREPDLQTGYPELKVKQQP